MSHSDVLSIVSISCSSARLHIADLFASSRLLRQVALGRGNNQAPLSALIGHIRPALNEGGNEKAEIVFKVHYTSVGITIKP